MNPNLYRYHPETGEDAEDITLPSHATEKDRIEFAEMRREGATFWWQQDESAEFQLDNGLMIQRFPIKLDTKTYSRVERTNIEFVAKVLNLTLVFNTDKSNAREP